jgi:hypothetical protein
MRLTENTKVRIKVPKHLYESIKEELEGQYEMKDSANLEEMEAERVAAESMMHAISSGDPFWTGVGLVLGIAGTIFAGAKAKDAKDKLIGWWKGLSAQQKAEAGKHLDTNQASGEELEEEVESKDVKVGSTYTYNHPKAGPVKVKALGKSSWGDDYFTVEAIEDKGEVSQGKQFNAELKNLDAAELEEAIDFQTLMEAVKDAAEKKKAAKAKEKAAKEKETEEDKKKKEAEAKKKAAAAKKK